ncbi:MAG: hypothetical protein QXL18_00805 [Candidatus Woesearchaeota archaeon]
MKLKTIKELSDEIELIPESELVTQYNNKKKNSDKSLESKINIHSYFSGDIFRISMAGADFAEKYGIVFFDVCYDPSYRRGMNGCAYTSELQIVDVNTLEKLFVETFNYRDIGNSPFNHRINFLDGKILKEDNNKILFGIESHELINFYEFNTITKEKELVESVDLDYKRRNKEKLEKFDKAFKELDIDAIESFIDERNMFNKIQKINDDYAIAMLYDPYGDTGERHAKTKLIVRNKGIIDLEYHAKQFESREVTQGFDIEDIKLMYDGENILLKYVIAESHSVMHNERRSSGGYSFIHTTGPHKKPIGRTNHTIKIDAKEFGLPINTDMKLEYLIEKESDNILAYGNKHKIPMIMQGFKRDHDVMNYAYSIDKVEHNGKNYVVVSKIIDMEHYANCVGGVFAYEQQLKVEVYEATDLETNPQLKLVSDFTTDTNDRKKYALKIDYNKNLDEMRIIKPQIEIKDNELRINYEVYGENFDKKEIRLRI